MTLQEEYELSCYRVLDRLWDDKEVYLVRHVETGKLFIKKQIDLYNQRVYEHLSRLDISGVPKIYLCRTGEETGCNRGIYSRRNAGRISGKEGNHGRR